MGVSSVWIHLPLRQNLRTKARMELEVATVSELIAAIERRHPGFRNHACGRDGRIHPGLNIYIDGEDARDTGNMSAVIPDGAEVEIVPAIG